MVDASSLVGLVAPHSSSIDEEQGSVWSHVVAVSGFEFDLISYRVYLEWHTLHCTNVGLVLVPDLPHALESVELGHFYLSVTGLTKNFRRQDVGM